MATPLPKSVGYWCSGLRPLQWTNVIPLASVSSRNRMVGGDSVAGDGTSSAVGPSAALVWPARAEGTDPATLAVGTAEGAGGSGRDWQEIATTIAMAIVASWQ